MVESGIGCLVILMKKLWKMLDLLLHFVRYSIIICLKHLCGRSLCVGELIAVLSGKGGTGKTSVCAGVAAALAASDARVLCIDCDVGLRNLDISLGLSDCGTLSFLDVCQGSYPLSRAEVHPQFPKLSFLTAPMNCAPEAIDTEAFGAMLSEARAQFDFVFLDAPAGVDTGFHLVSRFADRCILVTLPGPGAIRDASRSGELLELMGKTNVRLIVNRVNRKMVNAMELTIDDVMDTAGLPLLGVIPEDPNVTLAAAFGQPLLKYRPRCGAAQACRRIAYRIQGLPEPIKIR